MESRVKKTKHLRSQRMFKPHHTMAQAQTTGMWWRTRLSGPGGLYNAGNVIALVAGFAFSPSVIAGDLGLLGALQAHLLGSSEAAWLTAAMITFIIAGEIYHRAQHTPDTPNLLAWADFVAGLAAVLLTVALIQLGETLLCLIGGFMLIAGKLGSAALPLMGVHAVRRFDLSLRLLVLASRVPTIMALFLPILTIWQSAASLSTVYLPAIMIACFILWIRADLLLLKPFVRFDFSTPR